ncbi:MAG: class B sortase [Coriobacteriales bacterium]|jgi:sortase B
MSSTEENTDNVAPKHVSNEKKRKKAKKPWDRKSKVLLIVGIVLLVAALGIGGKILYSYMSADSEYIDLSEVAGVTMDQMDKALEEDDLLSLQVDWDSLKAQNPDVVGWIYVQGTDINYPIVQGDDNEYYLHHLYDGTYSNSGAIFLDYVNSPDFSDRHNMIYGHNMLNGSMFAQILQFKDQDFLNQGYKVLILTPEHAYVLAPAFTYICDGADQLRQVEFADDEDFRSYISELMKNAVTDSTVDTSKIDKMFSLVTCSYEANDVRTVLCCVQTEAVTYPNS